MYCFHSFDSRLLQGDVQTLQDSILGDFPLTVSESFPPFLSFISILFPLIPVFLLPSRLLPCIFLLHPFHLLLTLCTSRLLLFPPNPRFLPLLHRSFISSSPNPHMNPKLFRSDTLRVVPELSYVSEDAGELLSCTTFSWTPRRINTYIWHICTGFRGNVVWLVWNTFPRLVALCMVSLHLSQTKMEETQVRKVGFSSPDTPGQCWGHYWASVARLFGWLIM